MNTQNLDYLKDNLKYLGFGEKLNAELETNLKQGLPDFVLKTQNSYGKEDLDVQLYFRKSDQSDMYFFNRYDARLTNDAGSQSQTFYIQKSNGVTMKEAYNLLSGGAINKDLVNKEGQVYNAWMQINFKESEANGNFKVRQYHQNYGYDIEKSLSDHPIKELSNAQSKGRLIESLQRGNRQAVTFVKEGTEQKHFIEANPQFKTINVYDTNMQRINSRQQTGEKQEGASQAATKKENKSTRQFDADEDGPGIQATSKSVQKNKASLYNRQRMRCEVVNILSYGTVQALLFFFSAIENDPRISITHIGVYAALLYFWMQHRFVNPIQVYSYQIMPLAKISASNTYHKSIRQLNDYGYIRYLPSFKRNQASKVFILFEYSDQKR